MFVFFPTVSDHCARSDYPECKSFPGSPLNVKVSQDNLREGPIIQVTWEPPNTGESKEMVRKYGTLHKFANIYLKESVKWRMVFWVQFAIFKLFV